MYSRTSVTSVDYDIPARLRRHRWILVSPRVVIRLRRKGRREVVGRFSVDGPTFEDRVMAVEWMDEVMDELRRLSKGVE